MTQAASISAILNVHVAILWHRWGVVHLPLMFWVIRLSWHPMLAIHLCIEICLEKRLIWSVLVYFSLLYQIYKMSGMLDTQLEARDPRVTHQLWYAGQRLSVYLWTATTRRVLGRWMDKTCWYTHGSVGRRKKKKEEKTRQKEVKKAKK